MADNEWSEGPTLKFSLTPQPSYSIALWLATVGNSVVAVFQQADQFPAYMSTLIDKEWSEPVILDNYLGARIYSMVALDEKHFALLIVSPFDIPYHQYVEIVDVEKDDLGWRTSRVDEVCSSNKNSSTKAWEQDLNENVRTTNNANNWDNSNTRKSSTITSVTTSDEASKKFANAKAISSDMFFGDQDSGDKYANLSRFQGSTAISSDMYFNRESGGGGGMSRSSSNYSNMQAPDMDEVKESVRQGVNKVAGRLSNMASGVMNQIQDRYGY